MLSTYMPNPGGGDGASLRRWVGENGGITAMDGPNQIFGSQLAYESDAICALWGVAAADCRISELDD